VDSTQKLGQVWVDWLRIVAPHHFNIGTETTNVKRYFVRRTIP
jgi:hypothetical protein